MRKIFIKFSNIGFFHGALVLTTYRIGNFIYYKINIPIIRQLLFAIYIIIDYLIIRTILGSEFPAKCKIGKNFRLPHGGKGIIIEKNVQIGDNVILYHQVTIGINKSIQPPIIGNGVYIGAGAKILGPIKIGDNAKIGANSVVIKDVPEGSTAVGVPARIITRQ